MKMSVIRYFFYFASAGLPYAIVEVCVFLNPIYFLYTWWTIWIAPIFFTKENITLYDIFSETRVIKFLKSK